MRIAPRLIRKLRKGIKRRLGELRPGDPHHRAFVGPPGRYERMGHLQLETMVRLGLRPQHRLLDIGCGSLRAGRRFIPYLDADRYFGLEPNEWLVKAGMESELAAGLVESKRPRFLHDSDFTLTGFGERFDFMIAQSIFTHAAPAQIERCLAEASLALADGGVLVANFLEGDEDYTGTEWVYPGCCRYTLGFFERAAARHGLRCETFTPPEPWPGGLTMLRFERAPRS